MIDKYRDEQDSRPKRVGYFIGQILGIFGLLVLVIIGIRLAWTVASLLIGLIF